MVVFRVEVGAQVAYFEAPSFEGALRAAIAAQVPAHVLRAGGFFTLAAMQSDSKALALLQSL